MCLILFAHLAHPSYRLVVAANRDEFFRRPTAAADYWPDAAGVLAGRDLEKGGTWMGVTRDGRWSAVTNFRDGSVADPGRRSRGELVANYLRGDLPASRYAALAEQHGTQYHGYNLLVGDAVGLRFLSSRDRVAVALAPGFYGLSNASLDSPWPKVETGKNRMREALAQAAGPDRLTEALLALLADRVPAEDHLLPHTGISRDWEKRLSSAFIVAPGYGTRCSTVLLVDSEGEVHFRERSFGEGGDMIEDRRYRFVSSGGEATLAG